MGSNPVAVTSASDIAPVSSKEFLDIQTAIDCGFILKRVRDMIITYSQSKCFIFSVLLVIFKIGVLAELFCPFAKS